MDVETAAKVAQFEQNKFYSQAMEFLKAEFPKHKQEERWMEACLLKMTDLLMLLKDEPKIVPFLQSIACPMFEAIPSKAKTSKILKAMLDVMEKMGVTANTQTVATKLLVEWSRVQNRVYLRQSLETRLVSLCLQTKAFSDALTLIAALLKELKKLDDKLALVEVFLLESRCYHALRNVPKARAALTSARSSANAIYCPPLLQAQLDMQSGILHAEEKDFKTAYSYFYEAMEGYSGQNDPNALHGLKYMLLCKIMMGDADDVFSIMTGKMALKYQGKHVEAMKAIAKTYKARSLNEFQKCLSDFQDELQNDAIINFHLQALYDQLLEQNLIKIIEPYSRVQISHVAEIVKLPLPLVEQKLSQMILDKTFYGTLDQRHGTLHVFEETVVDKTFETAISTVQSMGNVVESLYEKARTL